MNYEPLIDYLKGEVQNSSKLMRNIRWEIQNLPQSFEGPHTTDEINVILLTLLTRYRKGENKLSTQRIGDYLWSILKNVNTSMEIKSYFKSSWHLQVRALLKGVPDYKDSDINDIVIV